MGIDYSLCLIAKREDSHSLLDNLCVHLDSRSRDRIATKKWFPESENRRTTLIGTHDVDARGIAGMQLADGESSNSYCLSLQVQIERDFEPLLADHRFKCFERPGSFGCMWTSIFAGNDYVLLEMTAATSEMSRVLQKSEAIHAIWIELAKNSNALFSYIDIEEQIAIQLFPTYGDLTLPDFQTLAFDGDYRFSVDRMVTFLLATATNS